MHHPDQEYTPATHTVSHIQYQIIHRFNSIYKHLHDDTIILGYKIAFLSKLKKTLLRLCYISFQEPCQIEPLFLGIVWDV